MVRATGLKHAPDLIEAEGMSWKAEGLGLKAEGMTGKS